MDLIINPPEGSSALGGVGTIHTVTQMQRYGGVPLYVYRGGSRNSSRGGSGPEFFGGGGGGVRVQVRRNFHILTSKKKRKTTSEGGGGLNPLKPPLDPPLVYAQVAVAIRSLTIASQK